MKKNNSASSLCQPSCGYFFSSGMIISETVYGNASHCALYNATSRIIIDGGRKALATAAMAGMIGQNLAMPANAVVIGPDTTSTVDVISTFEDYYVFGDNAILNVNGSALRTSLFQNGELNINDGGQTSYTLISHMGFENVNNGGYAFSTVVYSGGHQQIHNGGNVSGTVVNDGGAININSGGNASGIVQSEGGNINVAVIGNDANTSATGTNYLGQDFSLANGVANNFILFDRGNQFVYGDGLNIGSSLDTIVNQGAQLHLQGGYASGTVLEN